MGGNCNPFGGKKFHLPFAYVALWVQLKRKKIKHKNQDWSTFNRKTDALCRALIGSPFVRYLWESQLLPVVSRLAAYFAGHSEVSRCSSGQKC